MTSTDQTVTGETAEQTTPAATPPSPTQVIVYSYGVRFTRNPAELEAGTPDWTRGLPEPVTQQLRAGHRLREDLVSIAHDYEEQVKAIWSSYPAVAQAEETLAAAEEAARAASEAVAQARKVQRTKRITGPAAGQLRAALAEVKAARQARREAIGAVKEEAHARLAAAADARKAAEKDLYRIHAQEGALYHSTFTEIADAHRTALARVKKARSEGKPSALRHHRFDGTGRIAVKLQRSAGDPPRTPEMLADPASRYRNVLSLPGWIPPAEFDQLTRAEQRRRGRIVARMRVGGAGAAGGGEVIDIPLQIERMLPPEADITGARLVIRRHGSKTRAWLNITAKLPAVDPVEDGPVVAVHLGWRREDTGVRVATWRSTSPLDIPTSLRQVMPAHHDGTQGTIVVPDRLLNRDAGFEKAQSLRDEALEAIKAQLAAWLRAHGPVDHPVYLDRETGEIEQVTAAGVERWRAAGRFAILATHWRDNPPVAPDGTVGTDIATDLENWRAVDKLNWDAQAGGVRRLHAHRGDLYNQIAAVLGYQAGQVVFDDTRLADLARQAAADENLPNDIAHAQGHQRAFAAPGMLRETIEKTSRREGVPVTVVPAKDLSREHAACGQVNDTAVLRGHEVHCGCGRAYDVDANAVALMLTRAANAPGPTA